MHRERTLADILNESAARMIDRATATKERNAMTQFIVKYADCGPQKITVIREIRAYTNAGLKQAKDACESGIIVSSDRLYDAVRVLTDAYRHAYGMSERPVINVQICASGNQPVLFEYLTNTSR